MVQGALGCNLAEGKQRGDLVALLQGKGDETGC